MSEVERLRAALRQVLTVSLDVGSVPAMLTSEVDRLRRILGSTGGDQPARNFQREAVNHFRAHRSLPSLGLARAVCFGAVESFSEEEAPLIEDERIFSELLRGVDEYRPQPRQYRRCYRGLLHSYFTYDGEGDAVPLDGRHSWITLRDYLHKRLSAIQVEGGSQPEWAETIQSEANLLTQDPVGKYAPALLEGRRESVDRIRSSLEVNDQSWLMRRLVLSQIRVAIAEPDVKFKGRVSHLLRILSGHEMLENEGLKLVLDRYAGMSAPELNAGLRDRAIQSWGNPWLKRHEPNWTRVQPPARRLVANWLKLDLIRDFFEVLSDDRKTDPRRVKFWERFHEQIDDMYFALGSAAMHSRSADVRKLRDRMGDHLLELRRGGEGSNNAFIMMMGGIVAVEFGVKGNACFIYDRNRLPFELRREVIGDREGLRSQDHLSRLIHVDSSWNKWEEKFADELRRFGIARGEKPHIRLTTSNKKNSGGRLSAAATTSLPLNKQTLHSFGVSHGVVWSDKTHLGGNLSVQHDRRVGQVAEQLLAWGFTFSDTRRMWWRRDWP